MVSGGVNSHIAKHALHPHRDHEEGVLLGDGDPGREGQRHPHHQHLVLVQSVIFIIIQMPLLGVYTLDPQHWHVLLPCFRRGKAPCR